MKGTISIIICPMYHGIPIQLAVLFKRSVITEVTASPEVGELDRLRLTPCIRYAFLGWSCSACLPNTGRPPTHPLEFLCFLLHYHGFPIVVPTFSPSPPLLHPGAILLWEEMRWRLFGRRPPTVFVSLSPQKVQSPKSVQSMA